MATLSQLSTQRATAGARYSAAVTELHAALVDLAALDRVLANTNLNPTAYGAPTFSNPPQNTGWQFTHPVYAPYTAADWRSEINVAAASYMAAFTPGP